MFCESRGALKREYGDSSLETAMDYFWRAKGGEQKDTNKTGSVGLDCTFSRKLRFCCENDPLALLGQAV